MVQNNKEEQICKVCDSNKIEDETHVLSNSEIIRASGRVLLIISYPLKILTSHLEILNLY